MHSVGAAQGLGRDLRKTEKTHFALRYQFAHCADALFDGHARVNAMQVIEINYLNIQAAQTGLASFINMSRAAIQAEGVSVLVPDETTLGGQHHLRSPPGDRLP